MWGQDPCEKKLGDIAAWSNRLWSWMLTQIRGPPKNPLKEIANFSRKPIDFKKLHFEIYNPPKVCFMLLQYQYGPLFLASIPTVGTEINKSYHKWNMFHTHQISCLHGGFLRLGKVLFKSGHLLGALRRYQTPCYQNLRSVCCVMGAHQYFRTWMLVELRQVQYLWHGISWEPYEIERRAGWGWRTNGGFCCQKSGE